MTTMFLNDSWVPHIYIHWTFVFIVCATRTMVLVMHKNRQVTNRQTDNFLTLLTYCIFIYYSTSDSTNNFSSII